jgi:hypothetical protein
LYRTLLDDSVHAVCYISPSTAEPVEGVIVEPIAEFAQLQLGFVDQTQWRYEVIRPLVLFADRTAQQRAQETETHPDTVQSSPKLPLLQCGIKSTWRAIVF